MDLPTPPLPAPTATMLRMPGICCRPKPPRVLTLAVIFARAAVTPGSAATSASASAFIWSLTGQAGVVSSTVKSTSPPAISTSFTKPRVTMSLWRSGSCTLRRAESTCSWVTLTGITSRGRRQEARALSTTSCSFSNLVGGAPRILVRMVPCASITKVVGKPWLTPKASPVFSSPTSWR